MKAFIRGIKRDDSKKERIYNVTVLPAIRLVGEPEEINLTVHELQDESFDVLIEAWSTGKAVDLSHKDGHIQLAEIFE